MLALDVISSAGTFGALCAAIWQLRRGVRDNQKRDEEQRVTRSLALFDEVTAGGNTAEAFHRLSVALRAYGSEQSGVSTWHCLSDTDLTAGRFLDEDEARRDRLFADLYTVLWFFERAAVALRYNVANRDALMATLGYHFWWWGEILRHLHGPKAAKALNSLADDATIWASGNGVLGDWCGRCTTDFCKEGPKRCL